MRILEKNKLSYTENSDVNNQDQKLAHFTTVLQTITSHH